MLRLPLNKHLLYSLTFVLSGVQPMALTSQEESLDMENLNSGDTAKDQIAQNSSFYQSIINPSITSTAPAKLEDKGYQATATEPSAKQSGSASSNQNFYQSIINPSITAVAPAKVETKKPKIEVHGYIKLDAVNHSRIPFEDPIYAIPRSVPLNSDKPRNHSQTLLDARKSRIWVDGAYDYCGWNFASRIEIDFSTTDGSALSTNSRHLRLRHAYLRGDYKDRYFFLVGQWWSMLATTDIAWPFQYYIADHEGCAGLIFGRQPQARIGIQLPAYQKKGFILLSVGVEKQSVGTLSGEDKGILTEQGLGQLFPVIAAKLEWKKWEPLQMEFVVAGSQDRIIRASGKTARQGCWMYKAVIQSKIWKPTFYASFENLNGLNRLIQISYVDVASVIPVGFLDTNPRIRATRSWGGFVGFAVPVYECGSAKTILSGCAGTVRAHELPDTRFKENVYKRYSTWQIDLSHQFWETFAVAFEYKRFTVRTFNNKEGNLTQIAGALFYYF